MSLAAKRTASAVRKQHKSHIVCKTTSAKRAAHVIHAATAKPGATKKVTSMSKTAAHHHKAATAHASRTAGKRTATATKPKGC